MDASIDPVTRTSLTHPLQIAALAAGPGWGRIGLTLCPGKHQPAALTGGWARDLAADLDAIRRWGAAVVVTLVAPHELASLQVSALGTELAARQLAWLHLPIADAGVPDAGFERAWADAGAGLRARLRDGGDVLIHCKGGLGRAGMIAARLLVELGWAADQAIAAVRAVRPGAIETAAQLGHVHAARALPEPVPAATPAACRQRAVAALVGLAVGDALGTTLEFTPRDSRPPLTDMVGGGPFRLAPGQWTDDTALALALADSLLACPELDEADLMRRFCRWHEHGAYSCTGTCFDIGATTARALARWRRSGEPRAGATDPMSAGNGALMRLAPVALRWWRDPARLAAIAHRQSATTHAAPEALAAARAYAQLLGEAIAGRPRAELLAPRAAPGLPPRIAAILAGAWRGRRRETIASSGYVVHSLEAALWCVGRTASFAEAVLTAANLGDDADTTAAITGQLAGALHGLDAIPRRWRQQLAWAARIEQTARALVAAGLETAPSTAPAVRR